MDDNRSHALCSRQREKIKITMTPVLNIPGLGGSGPTHWQSRWEELYPDCRRMGPCNWNLPDKAEWMSALNTSILACAVPPIVVAHSLGCALLAHWGLRHNSAPIKAALMVAPTDVDNRDTIPAEISAFGPMPLGVLPFPTIVIASTNDHYVQIHRAQLFATAWGADFLNLGDTGHINADSHLGQWDFGWELVQNIDHSPAVGIAARKA
jgi:hypothetical protein